ncbi:MAG TPA: RNA-binding protein [Firmicutes bacterium]|nr:RNA-binding protein [Bacillota bacterium]HHY97233.1 RNA-binding protein [Bacillota bacterium]
MGKTEVPSEPWSFYFNNGKEETVLTTLYVGNLPWSTTDEDLEKIFSAHGTVKSTRVILDRETGRSRGFGFVEVEDADAKHVMEALNGADVNGRQIIVNEARPRQGR